MAPAGEAMRIKHCTSLSPANGSFDINPSDGSETETVQLNRPYFGLLIPPGTWRDMRIFLGGYLPCACVSEIYTEADYIRDYNEYLNF